MSAFTRQCEECTNVFEWSGVGRPPKKCDNCKGYTPSASPAEEKTPRRARRSAGAKKARKRAVTVRPSNGSGNGKGAVKHILAQLRGELADLQEREAHLQDAIAAMERLT